MAADDVIRFFPAVDRIFIAGKTVFAGADLHADERIAKHADWAEGFRGECAGMDLPALRRKLELEVGRVFEQVLCDCGVFPCTDAGDAAFGRYLEDLQSTI